VEHRHVRIGTAIAVGGLLVSMLGAGPAAAADPPADVVLDAVANVHQADPDEGPIAGATITITVYRDQASPIQTVTATTNASGDATLRGIARPADGASPILLDVRSDMTRSIVDANGCTETSSRSSEKTGLVAGPVMEIVLDPAAKSISIDCPEPTGAVQAATGRPQITPPSTDAAPGAARAGGRAPLLPIILVLVCAAAATVPLRGLAAAPGHRHRRPRATLSPPGRPDPGRSKS
jgi:hypothetical protein